ncbi:MAG: hypothetical protein AAB615_01645, partial [Patescibacteria group bacterium]
VKRSGLSMGDIDGSKRWPVFKAGFGGCFLQLKRLFQGTSRQSPKLFSSFAVFSFSFLSLFPALPEIQTENFATTAGDVEVISETEGASVQDIRCLWHEDVAFFSQFTDADKSIQEEECQSLPEKKEVQGATAETVPAEAETLVNADSLEMNKEIRDMVGGYPMESMVPAIGHFDRGVAGLIVGIAKKESNWGKRVPTKDGEDCFNYWGYKGAGSRGTAMGHGCFGSPEEAVTVVGGRIQELVEKRQGSDPARMVVWKCGSSCATHSPESVSKWISDVNLYYRQIAKN